ncbi:MAG: APC family permease [Solirubrobacteraceae bacterium]
MSDQQDRAAGGSVREGQPGPDATVTADAQLPALDDRAVAALRAAGRRWSAPMVDREALPVDPGLRYLDEKRSRQGRFVQIRSARPEGREDLEATAAGDEADSGFGRVGYTARRLLVGPPLRSTALAEERMGRVLALPVLSPDALSSVAYGPEAMLTVLVLAGSSQLSLSLPIAAVLVVLMLSVGLGYRQVIRAYPHGGGSYIVASDSLGAVWGLIAGAGLILDYILTVAVSVAAGVAAITSALPSLTPATVPIGLAVTALLVLGNLRGVRAAGALFAAPTYMFIMAIAMIVIVGLVKSGADGFHPVAPAAHHATEALGALLILRAFASGATAMTGIEVISNAVPVFEPPEAANARKTLSVMIVLLVTMFIGVVVIAHLDGASPANQTVLSQIAHDSVGNGPLYAFAQLSTMLVLLIAANSALNGFPRLLYFMARDGYVPRMFLHMGDRLAFTAGIVVLVVPAAILYAAFNGQTEPLIPLFAIGVFVAFTLAQSAMVAYWWRRREQGWRRALATNMLGAALSGAVALVAAITKFAAGAWIVVILIPLIVLVCRRIHRYYQRTGEELTPPTDHAPPAPAPALALAPPASGAAHAALEPEGQQAPTEIRNLAVVPIAELDLAALRALAYAASMTTRVLALHVSPSTDEANRFHHYWQAWGDHLPLEIVVSPYRATLAPLANYIEVLHRQNPEITLTVVVPELVAKHSWQRPLHNRVAQRLRRMLVRYQGIVITSVPFHLTA